MNQSAITVRYAKALYQVGEEKGNTEDLKRGVALLLASIKEAPEFNQLLQSPVIKVSEKKKIFSNVFSGKIDEVLINFFNLLADNKRESYLNMMCIYYLDLYKKEKGIKDAIFTTARPIDKKDREGILAQLKKKLNHDIEIHEHVNPDLIGGFKLRIDDQQVDASIASKLRKIKNELIN